MNQGMNPYEKKLKKDNCGRIKKLIEETEVLTYERCKEPDSSSCVQVKKDFTTLLSKFKNDRCEDYYPFDNGITCSDLLSFMYYDDNDLEKCIEDDAADRCGPYKSIIASYEESFSEFQKLNCGTKYR